jgi:hypothetical protein
MHSCKQQQQGSAVLGNASESSFAFYMAAGTGLRALDNTVSYFNRCILAYSSTQWATGYIMILLR